MAKAFEDAKTSKTVYLTMKRRKENKKSLLFIFLMLHPTCFLSSATIYNWPSFCVLFFLLGWSKLDTYSTKKIRAEEEATEKASGDTIMATDSQDKEYPTMVRLASGTKTKASTLVRTHRKKSTSDKPIVVFGNYLDWPYHPLTCSVLLNTLRFNRYNLRIWIVSWCNIQILSRSTWMHSRRRRGKKLSRSRRPQLRPSQERYHRSPTPNENKQF